MSLKPEQVEAARQKQALNILRKLQRDEVVSPAQMRLLQSMAAQPAAVPLSPPLPNEKQEAFARGLAGGVGVAEAYAAAGYKPDRGHASRLAARAVIQHRVDELREEARGPALRPPMLPSSSSPTRARSGSSATLHSAAVRTRESMSLGLMLALDEAFPDDVLIGLIRDMQAAERSFQQDGMLVTAPDWNARAKGIELAIKYRNGEPLKQAEPRVAKGLDGGGLAEKLRKSPAFRAGLRDMLAEAEAATPEAPPAGSS